MRILCLFVRYGTSHYCGSFDRLVAWYATWIPTAEVKYVVIDNALTTDRAPEGIAEVYAGNNDAGEFSGFAEGLGRSSSQLAQYDLVHFVTSAYEQNYNRYLEHVDTDALAYAARSQTCLGHIDSYDTSVRLLGHRSRHWIRTSFFFMAPGTISVLATWDNAPFPDCIFNKEGTIRDSAPLCHDLRRNISDWLSGAPQQGNTYHSPALAKAEFQRKVMAILREHSLSIALREKGVWLLDFAFAFTLADAARNIAEWHGSSWKVQIDHRTEWLSSHPPSHHVTPVPALQYDVNIPFGSDGLGACRRSGWSLPETGFCWSDGFRAVARWRLQNWSEALHLTLQVAAFPTLRTAEQFVRIRVNGACLLEARVPAEESRISVSIPHFILAQSEVLNLSIELPRATSPYSRGLSADSRQLGIRVIKAHFTIAKDRTS